MKCDEIYIYDYVEQIGKCFEMVHQIRGWEPNKILSRLCKSEWYEDVNRFSPFLIDGMSSTELTMKLFDIPYEEFKNYRGGYWFHYWIGAVIAYYHACHELDLKDLLIIDWNNWEGSFIHMGSEPLEKNWKNVEYCLKKELNEK